MLLEHYSELAETAGVFVHEIKNHLSTLILSMQLLAEDFENPQSPRERRALERITRLQGEFSKVMQIVDVREKLAVLGSEAVGGGSADFAKHLRTEQDKWGRLIQQAGIRLE